MAASSLSLSDNRTAMAEINITPLIDVMLALMLIFMLTAPLTTLRVPLPMSNGEPTRTEPRTLTLSIDAQGVVHRNGYSLSPMEVEAELASFGSKGGEMSLQLQPDANASHQAVMGVITKARNAEIKAIALEMPSR